MRKIIATFAASTLISFTSQLASGGTVDIDPDKFAPGQNITFSNVIFGVQLLAMRVTQNLHATNPNNSYVPIFSSVYAQAVTVGCFSFTTCAPPGSSEVFGFSKSPTPSSTPILWGQGNSAADCLMGACDSVAAAGLQQGPALVAHFTVPTDLVSLDMTYFQGDGGFVDAFNSKGELIGTCFGYPLSGSCVTALSKSASGAGWAKYTINGPDISYIVAGGAASYRSIGDLQYDRQSVPEPSDLLVLATGAFAVVALHACRRRLTVKHNC
jgi:hypothetical protein